MLIGLTTSWVHLKAHMEAKQTCRIGLIKSQMKAKKTIQLILAMNKKAAALKAQKQILLIQLGGCLISPATCNPIALAKYQRIIQEQEALDALQKTTILQGEKLMTQEYLKTAQSIQKISSGWKEWVGLTTKLNISRPQIALEPVTSEKGSLYKLKSNFETLQAANISWRQTWHLKFNKNLNGSGTTHHDGGQSLACSASLNEELLITLQAVRLSPNSWSY